MCLTVMSRASPHAQALPMQDLRMSEQKRFHLREAKKKHLEIPLPATIFNRGLSALAVGFVLCVSAESCTPSVTAARERYHLQAGTIPCYVVQSDCQPAPAESSFQSSVRREQELENVMKQSGASLETFFQKPPQSPKSARQTGKVQLEVHSEHSSTRKFPGAEGSDSMISGAESLADSSNLRETVPGSQFEVTHRTNFKGELVPQWAVQEAKKLPVQPIPEKVSDQLPGREQSMLGGGNEDTKPFAGSDFDRGFTTSIAGPVASTDDDTTAEANVSDNPGNMISNVSQAAGSVALKPEDGRKPSQQAATFEAVDVDQGDQNVNQQADSADQLPEGMSQKADAGTSKASAVAEAATSDVSSASKKDSGRATLFGVGGVLLLTILTFTLQGDAKPQHDSTDLDAGS